MDDYKIAFIYGNDNMNESLKNGSIHYYGEVSKGKIHSMHLLDYTAEYYPEVSIFKQLNVRHQPEVIAYFLVRMGHIVFFNTTKYDEDNLRKYGRTGFFMLPDTLTEKQQEYIGLFAKQISDYNIFITYDIEMIDGILDSKTYNSVERVTPIELIKNYINNQKDKTLR